MWAVLPLKPLESAKQRLSNFLTSDERQALVKVMAEDVILALLRSPHIDNILVTSKESYAIDLATRYQLPTLCSDQDVDLNSAVQASADYLIKNNVSSMMVIHGDIPQLKSRDINATVKKHSTLIQDSGGQSAVSVMPDNVNRGTNGLITTPVNAIPFHYGANSLGKHKAAALSLNVPFQTCEEKSLAIDIDAPQDLAKFAANLQNSSANSLTFHYMLSSGITERLKPLLQAPTKQTQPQLEEFKSARIQVMV